MRPWARGPAPGRGHGPGWHKTFGLLSLHQIDSVNILVRAHYPPAFSRLGRYHRRLINTRAGDAGGSDDLHADGQAVARLLRPAFPAWRPACDALDLKVDRQEGRLLGALRRHRRDRQGTRLPRRLAPSWPVLSCRPSWPSSGPLDLKRSSQTAAETSQLGGERALSYRFPV